MSLIDGQALDDPNQVDRPVGPSKPMAEYHIIVGQSTPQAGGMCRHMEMLADGLASQSHPVHVWSPQATDLGCESAGVEVHKTLGDLSVGDLRQTGRMLNSFPSPRRILVYWVPHAYGYKSMNLQFCLWLWFRSLWRKDRVELMVQECFFSFTKRSWRQNLAAVVHRLMTMILLRAADHVWVALPGYEGRLKPFALGRRVSFSWLPVPANVDVVGDAAKVAEIRAELAPSRFLIGHFGTFGAPITDLLEKIVPVLLRGTDASLVLLGSGGKEFRESLIRIHPDLASRLHATGYLDDAALSCFLSACDVMIQPYPDGLTARRGSALAPLAHGRPVISNVTAVTEALWQETGAVVFAPATGDGFLNAVRSLRQNAADYKRVSAAARETYLRYFEPSHMIQIIRAKAPATPAVATANCGRA